ncbi:MAG TPA: hypothetical protein EYH31_02595, partial [Anaerolineae bacterium]|nr:hypothetical protein [Anaerolineae bacterium]
MLRYVGRRLILLIPVLLGVTVVTFAILQFIPGDPAEAMLGEEFDAAIAAEIERTYGLDKPVWLNLSRWVDTGAVVAQEYVRATDTQFTVSDASLLEVDQTIRVDEETMRIQQIIGNRLIVQRGVGPLSKARPHKQNADVQVRGFNNPLDSQYFHFLSNALHFNF